MLTILVSASAAVSGYRGLIEKGDQPTISTGLHPFGVCIYCPVTGTRVPPAVCNPPCTSFTVTITSATVSATGTSISAYWDSSGYYTTTYSFGYGPTGGSTTWVNTNSGTSYTVNGLTEGISYTLHVDASMKCASGTMYTASTSKQVTTNWTWTVWGQWKWRLHPALPRYTRLRSLRDSSWRERDRRGTAGSYSFTLTSSATSATVCAEAPGYHQNTGIPNPANPAFAECDLVSVTGG